MRMSSVFRTRFGLRTPHASNTLGHSIFGIGYGCRDGLPGCCPCAESVLSRRLLCDARVCKPTQVGHPAAAGAGPLRAVGGVADTCRPRSGPQHSRRSTTVC